MTTISVYIPTYNQRRELLDAAVRSALNTGADEIILVDDGSDRPVENRWDPKVKLIRIPHAGVHAAFYEGIKHLTGDYTCRMGSDDAYYPEKLAVQREWMARARFPATFHDVRENDGSVHRPKFQPADRVTFRKRLARQNLFYAGSTMVETEILRAYVAAGGHPETLTYGHDWHLANWIEHEVGWEYLGQILMIRGRYPHGLCAQAQRDPVLWDEQERCRQWVRARWGHV